MNLFLDSFWRAVAYCLHPRVIALSFLPLAIMVVLSLGLGYFFWAPVIEWVRVTLETSDMMQKVWGWLQDVGAANLKTVVAPLIVIFALTPVIVLLSLLLVAIFMGPALSALVAERRFPQLERKRGGSLAASIVWSLGSTMLAAVALIISLPLWLVPPLILILPPLIWGWLTYRVMAFDALSEHASRDERRAVFRRHRPWLLGIGVLAGYLGAAPSIVWASGALFAAAFVILIPVAIWIYTLVFAFASLWFAHYCLAALDQLRSEESAAALSATPVRLQDDINPPA
ncbi:MAG TPA: EI24 domain-containing protein [Ramlibacter sp.]|nr:EI24 domain-containing protein [Ramlibacter sp.]